jgi:hypothetical protein
VAHQPRTPEWPYANAVAQPLLTGLGIAAWQGLAPRLPAPAVVAGYSVGELAAFCVAGCSMRAPQWRLPQTVPARWTGPQRGWTPD